ncbi:hypothetical protein, partial [Cronobacter sakazakii]|uniref:hypothetical protein n=1 Tax=Cronobacter sakazakii TaxID=28141 RepID=UPI002016151F
AYRIVKLLTMYKFANNTQKPDRLNSIYALDPNDNNGMARGIKIRYIAKANNENRNTLKNTVLGMLVL